MESQHFKRPKYLRGGATMTLTVHEGDYREQRGGRLDVAAAVERLRAVGRALDDVSSSVQPPGHS